LVERASKMAARFRGAAVKLKLAQTSHHSTGATAIAATLRAAVDGP